MSAITVRMSVYLSVYIDTKKTSSLGEIGTIAAFCIIFIEVTNESVQIME